VSGWSGDQCQYPPNCNIRCSNDGWPNDAMLAIQPGNSWGCTYCDCSGYWEGTTCNKCGIQCYNGGSVDSLCFSCKCPAWYTGDNCQNKYWIASFKVDLNPPNVDLKTASGSYTFAQAVLEDLMAALPISGAEIQGNGNTVTLWIAAGDSSPVIRAQVQRQLFGANYWGALGNQGLGFQSTLTGEKVVLTSYMQSDPPSAGAFTTPSLLLTVIILFVGLLLN